MGSLFIGACIHSGASKSPLVTFRARNSGLDGKLASGNPLLNQRSGTLARLRRLPPGHHHATARDVRPARQRRLCRPCAGILVVMRRGAAQGAGAHDVSLRRAVKKCRGHRFCSRYPRTLRIIPRRLAARPSNPFDDVKTWTHS